MAKSNLASMTIEALIEMRDDIGKILSAKAGELQRQFAALGDGGWVSSGTKTVGRPKGRSQSQESGRNLGRPGCDA
jgi:hypothetical protein